MCESTYEKYMMEYQKALDETYGYVKNREVSSKKEISHPIEGDILTPTKNDIHTMPCNLKGCDANTRASCCGCPEQLEWERERKKENEN